MYFSNNILSYKRISYPTIINRAPHIMAYIMELYMVSYEIWYNILNFIIFSLLYVLSKLFTILYF